MNNPMYLQYQPEHEDSFSTEVGGGCDAGMTQELMGGFYDPGAAGHVERRGARS